jgi:hypothetical protein
MSILARSMLTRDFSYDLDEWRHFWQAETQRYDSPPIYMAYLTLFDLHVGLSSVPRSTRVLRLLRPEPKTS